MQAFAPFYLFVASYAFYCSISMELQSSPGQQMQTCEISLVFIHTFNVRMPYYVRAIIGKTDSEIHNLERAAAE